MLILELNEQQYKALFDLLDRDLKSGGLNSLVGVVELHNLLLSAKQKEQPKHEEDSERT